MNYNLQNLLVNKQCGLAISGVAKIESATRFDDLIIEEVGHLWLGITVYEPHQINIMVFSAEGYIMLAT